MRAAATSTDLDFVERFAAAAEQFAAAVGSADLRAPVAACPGWSSYDLVRHLGNVHAWAATIVETGRPAAHQDDEPRSRRSRVVSEWYVGKAGDLFEVLRSCDPASECWTLAGPGSARFWRRRQLHETTMHHLDLDLARAAGGGIDIDPQVAVDGVAEVLDVLQLRMHERGHPTRLSAPLCLVATDTGDAWTLTPAPAGPRTLPLQPRGSPSETAPPPPGPPPVVVGRRHPSADRIEAPAAVLYQLLWKRADPNHADVTVVGDPDRVAAFLASRLVP